MTEWLEVYELVYDVFLLCKEMYTGLNTCLNTNGYCHHCRFSMKQFVLLHVVAGDNRMQTLTLLLFDRCPSKVGTKYLQDDTCVTESIGIVQTNQSYYSNCMIG